MITVEKLKVYEKYSGEGMPCNGKLIDLDALVAALELG